jgi:hypothetical protein
MPPLAPYRRRRVQHLAISISCVCLGDRLVLRSAEAADVSAPTRAGQTLSNGGPEGLPHLARPATAPKPPIPQTEQLVRRDATGFWSPTGPRQPTAPTAPHQQRQRRVACRQPCQPACRLVGTRPRGLWMQAGVRQLCRPLPLSVLPSLARLQQNDPRWSL